MCSDAIEADRYSFTTGDGVQLSYSTWSRDAEGECQNLVLILHGIGFHSAPYRVLANGVHLPNTVFAGLDFRGHGRSGGTWGELASVQRMLADIEEWVSHLRGKFPGAKVFLFGESMAGPYAALYAVNNPDALAGLILTAPAVFVSLRQAAQVETIKAVADGLLSPWNGYFTILPSRLAESSRDINFITNRSKDPLSMRSVSRRYVMNIAHAIASLVLRPSLAIKAPMLIVHGTKDNVISPVGSKLLMRRVKSPEKRLVMMPGAYHTLLWDPTSPEVFSLLERWIAQHAGIETQAA